MVQNIQTPNGVQQVQQIGFGTQGNTFIVTKPYEQDSFNGKTLLKIGGVLGAIYFRKNILGVLKNMFPNVSKLGGSAWDGITKPFRKFIAANRTNPIIKTTNKAKSYIKKFFNWFSYKGKDAVKNTGKQITVKPNGNQTYNVINNAENINDTFTV